MVMFLSPRQIRIFFNFYNQAGEAITLGHVAEELSLSTRTIQNDISAIRDASEEYGIEILSVPGTGCILNILDKEKADEFVKLAQKHLFTTNEFFNQKSRVDFLISYLINQTSYIKSSDLADMLYISQSRISSDLKILRETIAKYNLSLESKPSHGIKIYGSEVDKRLCLIKESIFAKPVIKYSMDRYIENENIEVKNHDIQIIGDILTDTFLSYKYRISEILLQNLIVHIQVAITRIKMGYPLILENKQTLDLQYYHVEKMAREILIKCSEKFNIPFYEDEVMYLAINIFGKRELDNEDFITSETSKMILHALLKIKDQYQIDLTNELDLRVALALHITPLMTRVKNNMQFNNLAAINIKQTYPLAYNIANDFASYIFSDNVQLTNDEISYITVHFVNPVEKKITNLSNNNILIICPYRQSDIFLIKQKIFRNMNNINEIKVISESQMAKENLNDYGAVLSTEKHIALKNPMIRHINFFLDEQDLKKIDFALRGLKTLDYILDKFNPHLFYKGKIKSKKLITEKLITLVHNHFGENKDFEKSVLSHEEKTPSSYFGNSIAILHPEEPVSDTTFIAVALLDEAISWDMENSAKIVLLVSIEKNNPSAFKLWNILSELISNDEFVENIDLVNDFDMLHRLIKQVYSSLF